MQKCPKLAKINRKKLKQKPSSRLASATSVTLPGPLATSSAQAQSRHTGQQESHWLSDGCPEVFTSTHPEEQATCEFAAEEGWLFWAPVRLRLPLTKPKGKGWCRAGSCDCHTLTGKARKAAAREPPTAALRSEVLCAFLRGAGSHGQHSWGAHRELQEKRFRALCLAAGKARHGRCHPEARPRQCIASEMAAG